MPHDLTRDGLISALTPSLLPQTKPVFLRDLLRMKRNRGDADVEQFKLTCREFGSGLNATISGAAWAMRQWVAKADRLGWTDMKVARCTAFLADLDAVLAGNLTGWDIARAAA
ncbi:MAG: hypothetical protein M9939_26425 [Mesorhizobium sp.]|nr:hypothetical protein [Mesorhizobium sp.]MCO5085117.1 hypothetical protein [Rhizobiaceae bacterium]MCO5164629.1 hypothetical protein [Mesorhizobium sp.]